MRLSAAASTIFAFTDRRPMLVNGRFNSRRCILLTFYSFSIILSGLAFLFSGVYCRLGSCNLTWNENNRQYAQIFAMVVACIISFLSATWLIANACYIDSLCFRDYCCLEMPSAVLCTLLAGISAVIEIHYSFDYSYLYYHEQWSLASAMAIGLVFIHASQAFALT